MANTGALKKKVISRLNRVTGQINGVKRMVEVDRDCADIIIQMSAIRAAVGQLGALIVQEYMEDCIASAIRKGRSKEVIKSLNQIMKQMLK